MPHPPGGYHGQYLRVNLTTQQTDTVPIPEAVLRRFIGGSGLGTWILLQETEGTPDPLSPNAPLVFVFSPLVGSPLTTSAKFAVLAKSPLTHRINDSLSSSTFAIAGKRTGYDALVVTGKAHRPTCLVIEEESVWYLPADRFQGLSSAAATEAFHQETQSRMPLVSIGRAGENLVSYATISHDGRHAGRGGLGAVMGSKKLKIIAVNGNQRVKFPEPEKLTAYAKQLSEASMGPATAKYRELGTISNLLTFNRLGTLPTRNFQQSTFAAANELTPQAMETEHPRTRKSCAACTIGCEHLFHRGDGSGSGVRMEYENLYALGPLCGISDPDVVLQASALCDEYGLDTISVGATIAFAMECAEKGLIDLPDLRFGNGSALLEMLHDIAHREGQGDALSYGSRHLAESIGHDSIRFAPQVKGLELPGYEPRALHTMALGFAVGTRGADHNRSGAYQVDFSSDVDRMNLTEDAVPLAIETENESALFDSLILCKFLRGVFTDRSEAIAEMLSLVTGWEVTVEELRETAERIVTAKKLYNIQQGWTPEEDWLPERFFNEELSDGASAGGLLDPAQLRRLITKYNQLRRWTDEGEIPTPRLAELGLSADG